MLKILTLKFEEKLENFNDAALTNFLADKNVVKWEGQFFERKGSPFWTVLLEYEPGIPCEDTAFPPAVEKTKNDYKKLLQEKDWPLYKRLREWRLEAAGKEGVPQYVIFTNMQLAKIASARPESINVLRLIEGVGDKKIKKYGETVISMIKTFGKLPAPGKGESGNG